jgi:hypothetical protein
MPLHPQLLVIFPFFPRDIELRRSKGVLCMKLIASATLSVPLLCLSQSESLSQLAQLELDSVRTQPARPCHVQLSNHLP